jgi:hypothetical protein
MIASNIKSPFFIYHCLYRITNRQASLGNLSLVNSNIWRNPNGIGNGKLT